MGVYGCDGRGGGVEVCQRRGGKERGVHVCGYVEGRGLI